MSGSYCTICQGYGGHLAECRIRKVATLLERTCDRRAEKVDSKMAEPLHERIDGLVGATVAFISIDDRYFTFRFTNGSIMSLCRPRSGGPGPNDIQLAEFIIRIDLGCPQCDNVGWIADRMGGWDFCHECNIPSKPRPK